MAKVYEKFGIQTTLVIFTRTRQPLRKKFTKIYLWKQYNSSLRSKQISKMPPIYHKDIQTLTVESFKINSSICSEIVSDIFFTGTGIHNKPM